MCDLHYRRSRHHGNEHSSRPADHGSRRKHPLYTAWNGLMRVYRLQCIPEWLDFWRFAADVPLPEKDGSRFRRIRMDEPYGPGNWFWFEVERADGDPEKRREYARQRHRRLNAANPDHYLNKHLLKHFGITLDEYRAMLDRQGGVCAICREPETMRINGDLLRLSVDHCHDTGKVRGLLCCKCNQALGCFRHDVDRMLAAVDYLKGFER